MSIFYSFKQYFLGIYYVLVNMVLDIAQMRVSKPGQVMELSTKQWIQKINRSTKSKIISVHFK